MLRLTIYTFVILVTTIFRGNSYGDPEKPNIVDNDPGDSKNLANDHPELVQKSTPKLNAWLAELP